MESILEKAIYSAQQCEIAFSKFITANDTGVTGGHQAGFHIHQQAWQLLFDSPGKKGTNKDKFVTIRWQDVFETNSRFIYYGTGTRNEYRLTRFGRGFPYLQDEQIGNLLVLCKKNAEFYEAFVLQTEDEIDGFFAAMNISSNSTNGIIPRQFEPPAEDKLLRCFMAFLKSLEEEFPPTLTLASNARNCYNGAYNIIHKTIKGNPDREILNWLDAEFQLFKLIENERYKSRIQTPFENIESLIETANTILNRRKSRAGKSLEHHLSEVFSISELAFATQAKTEDNKKPDFLFPNVEAYLDGGFNVEKLVVLAAKTTCKDRWRQVLNEADRVKTKHLFTLQQGVSSNQLEEMYRYNVCLVVPKPYLNTFPIKFQSKILTLEGFIDHVRQTQM